MPKDLSSHWICRTCKKPLDWDGAIYVFNNNPKLGAVGQYPIDPSPDEPPWVHDAEYVLSKDRDVATNRETAEWQVKYALWMNSRPVNVEYAVFHDTCNPYKELSAYQIDICSAETWMAWVHHLAEKNWMGRWDLVRMMSFYWTQCGERPTLGF